ncbi:PREDICTED: uncharacterized protein LOC104733560 [Camelina sativa]|uniref:Uncharacterized protein LOC104733560 n=1 Tax=Camelina sativa TaxID=90675 RepID=A0ABM0V658_CAMSA|nr:PREDICTED: uncharacterized protein LOC104733560 [Camelina sativa]
MAQLTATFVPEDVAIISALPMRQPDAPDLLGWHFTKSGKYSVKSGYHVLRSKPTASSESKVFGPDIVPLQAFVWKIKCPPKLRHFMWQMLWQVWALSRFPTSPASFPSESVFTNMDFLFWRFTNVADYEFFPWILWYIWKARNDKIFSNLDSNPLAILRLAEDEAKAWALAQLDDMACLSESLGGIGHSESGVLRIPRPHSSYMCFVDGSWKATDRFAGSGWFCTSPWGDAPIMGAANHRRSLSPLHAEVEALVWAMRCMIGADNQSVVFLTDCSDLVKMVSSPSEWPAFTPYLEDLQMDKEEFTSFSLVYVPRSQNFHGLLALHRNQLPLLTNFHHIGLFEPILSVSISI